jgi:hypothetical protein
VIAEEPEVKKPIKFNMRPELKQLRSFQDTFKLAGKKPDPDVKTLFVLWSPPDN